MMKIIPGLEIIYLDNLLQLHFVVQLVTTYNPTMFLPHKLTHLAKCPLLAWHDEEFSNHKTCICDIVCPPLGGFLVKDVYLCQTIELL